MKDRLIDRLLLEYGESHQNSTNKTIHWLCVPLIMFSLLGLFMCIPFPMETTLFLNWSVIFLLLVLVYYLRLSFVLFLSFIVVGSLMVFLNYKIFELLSFDKIHFLIVSIIIFFVAWIGQFYGHKLEGKKPSFLKDLQFLLIGPAWLLHFIFKKIGIPY